MRKHLTALVLAGLGLLFTVQSSNAAPARVCSPHDESLVGTLFGLTYDGKPADMSDAGALYEGPPVIIDAVAQPEAACGANAKQVKVRVTDPWTGEIRELTLGGSP